MQAVTINDNSIKVLIFLILKLNFIDLIIYNYANNEIIDNNKSNNC